uniref:Kunitoxi-like protein n=1 Tax=Simulium guianense TaxID=445764 RepID=F5GTX0_SIMGU
MTKLSVGIFVLIGFIGLLFVVDAMHPDCKAPGPNPKATCNGKYVFTYKNKKCMRVKSCLGKQPRNQFWTGGECINKCLMPSIGRPGTMSGTIGQPR